METAKFNVLETIIQITEQTKNSKMEENELSSIRNELIRLADYLQINENQAMFFAVIFSINYELGSVALDELADHFNFSSIRILLYHEELEDMIKKGVLESESQFKRKRGMKLTKKTYIVPNHLNNAVLENKKAYLGEEPEEKDFTGFLQDMEELFGLRKSENIPTNQLFDEAEGLIERYADLEEVQKIEEFGLNPEEKLLYCLVCRSIVSGENEVRINSALEVIFDNIREQFLFKKWLFQQKGPLFEKNLLEWSKSNFRDKRNISLTEKSLQMLFGEDAELFMNREEMQNAVKPVSIEKKDLFYNPLEEEKVTFLTDLLKKEKLSDLQTRLKERNMPEGVTVLLYGNPGTGKTETARQLARQTGREIIHVDLSDTKSMWFGESEKKVSEIFESYDRYSKKQEKLPILLFNEADALFSKRGDSHRSPVAQTENAIQNILLEQLEQFEGILIATTNLTGNLDGAFDRRFLYKIRFSAPNVDVKSKIWRSKLHNLSEEASYTLARKYDFSGGQIDNVARKIVTEEVLYNQIPGLEKIMEFCEGESIQKGSKRIGFFSE
ncbi:MAG: ATP-binding protein [Bacteroidota bacterium]